MSSRHVEIPAPPSPEQGTLFAGTSPAAQRLTALITRVAGTPRTTVLVRGERGTGRRETARQIHARSLRAAAPCVEVRAADSLAAGFVEALFGPEGRLREACGGTLLITEVQSLAAGAQQALLAELSDPTVDVRIVTTTSADLEEEVERGRFREDLFYRINVLAVDLPPLRERREDVLTLARGLLGALAGDAGVPCPGLSADAASALREHDWPGNLRELRGVLEAALARMPGGILSPGDLALPGATPVSGVPEAPEAPDLHPDSFGGERNLRALEERVIRLVLRETGGNKSRAARLLGLNRQTLYNKLQAFEPAPGAR